MPEFEECEMWAPDHGVQQLEDIFNTVRAELNTWLNILGFGASGVSV
jgi:hypothetical protein